MQNILADIHQYSQKLTISQVITFFARNGITISKSMVQNYVRDGLLAPPVNKRHYTHKHLAVLAVVAALKPIYEIADIKAVLEPLVDGEGLDLEKYSAVVAKTEELGNAWRQNVLPLVEDSDSLTLMLHVAELRDM